MGKHVLITGFEPFGGNHINPSESIVRSLDGRLIAGRSVVGRVLPVVTNGLRGRLESFLHDEEPDIIIAFGLAPGRPALSLERAAVNVLDFSVPDNVGTMLKHEPIVVGGPDARLATIPFEPILDAWREGGVPGYISNAAGTYICNQVLYELLTMTQSRERTRVAGFIHLPYLPEQAIAAGAGTHPSMSLDLMQRGVELAIETTVTWLEDRTLAVAPPHVEGSQMWIPRAVKELER